MISRIQIYRELVPKLRKEISQLKDKVKDIVRCEKCKKIIGYKKNNHYHVNTGVIQIGQGLGKEFLSFCSEKCKK